ncbi:hypothetical protein LB533_16290 [Mesorhizobium sp. BR1-1-13]|uniref:hypothetical protein n=1 Tax=Mesorhizobium sp. BR1-1-13 TaxID=2876656 RepID=UPI001CD0E6BD|nr:hypothetical protein [Mesorhizobium sp. BR1-1-13]MBZ9942652.1 hypothetical protein [Mesorhizobium sp. BR1-1-13]
MSDLEVSIWFAKIKANGPLAVIGTLLAAFALAVLVLFCGTGGLQVGVPSVFPNGTTQSSPTKAEPLH